MENKLIHAKEEILAAEKNIQFASTLRKNYLKQPQDVIEVCSRHNQCMIDDHSKVQEQTDSFLVNSDLLQQIEPQQIDIDPLFEYQSKPQIQMLGKINIKKKKYEKMMKTLEKQQLEKQRKEKIEKINKSAKIALQHSKKVSQENKTKWGHSLFEIKTQKEQKEQKKEEEIPEKSKQKKKLILKDIKQRITDYKNNELRKAKSTQNLQRNIRQDVNVEQCNEKIKENAQNILQEMKDEKQKVLQQKKIIQAKIRAIQLKSLQKVKNCKKKPFQGGQFDLGDSQYSTFEARAVGRKIQKKKKKQKKPLPQPNLLETKKFKPSKKSTKRDKSVKKEGEKTASRTKVDQQREIAEEKVIKGPFYIWNMPIMAEDLEKIDKPSKEVFMNVNRFNYKQGKTFREEANEYLAKKMESKFHEARQKTKEQIFLGQVEKKKEILQKQYQKQNCQKVNEFVWNEDELFRPNILQNFHFFSRE